jgi:prepilin-type N-terminal cleavage/methylation domain-containing protein
MRDAFQCPVPVRQQAFTLIELLVVVGIITILSGMVVTVIPMIKRMASQTVTNQRMQQILQGLATYGQERGAAAALQDAAGLGGVSRFADLATVAQAIGDPLFRVPKCPKVKLVRGAYNSDTEESQLGNSTGSFQFVAMARNMSEVLPSTTELTTVNQAWFLNRWPLRWAAVNVPAPGRSVPILPFPWGKPPLRLDGSQADPVLANGSTTDRLMIESTAAAPTKQAISNRGARSPDGSASTAEFTTWSAIRSDGSTLTAESHLPQPFDLGLLSPIKTVALLQAAGILEGDDSSNQGPQAYRTLRDKSKPWNDHWGNPLVVSAALFQPERYRRDADEFNRRDLFLKAAKDVYGYNRSLYIAVGATGPTAASGLNGSWSIADDEQELVNRWNQIRDVCKAKEWTEEAWVAPVWKDVRVTTRGAERCMLTAPLEIR